MEKQALTSTQYQNMITQQNDDDIEALYGKGICDMSFKSTTGNKFENDTQSKYGAQSFANQTS